MKVPDALKKQGAEIGSYRVVIDDPLALSALKPQKAKKPGDLRQLSPADALFGCMGYRGRVCPNDGMIEGPSATEPLRVAPLDGPVMHRLAKPGAAKNEGSKIRISKVEGRKFYYDGEIVTSRQEDQIPGGRYEWIDQVPVGCTIRVDVHLDSVTKAELGALLISAGYGDDVGIVRFGGFKPVGLGKVELQAATARFTMGRPSRAWKRPETPAFDLDAAVQVARNRLIDTEALRELHQVTTRRRPL